MEAEPNQSAQQHSLVVFPAQPHQQPKGQVEAQYGQNVPGEGHQGVTLQKPVQHIFQVIGPAHPKVIAPVDAGKDQVRQRHQPQPLEKKAPGIVLLRQVAALQAVAREEEENCHDQVAGTAEQCRYRAAGGVLPHMDKDHQKRQQSPYGSGAVRGKAVGIHLLAKGLGKAQPPKAEREQKQKQKKLPYDF